VRLLRLLAASAIPLTQAVLAQRAGLNLSGVGRSIAALEELGIVEYTGAGARRSISMRWTHPLAPAIKAIFDAERARFTEIVERLREAGKHLRGAVRAIWIQGPVATGTDRVGQPLVLGVLASARELQSILDALAKPIDVISEDLDVTIECRGVTMADIEAMPSRDAEALDVVIPIVGPPPDLLTGRAKKTARRTRSHADIDADALARAEYIAALLRRDPGLVDRARDFLEKRMATGSASELRDLKEWDRILRTASPARLRQILTEPGERGARLRQSMPFLEAVPPEEQVNVSPRPRRNRKR
jgi:hypothetical protein